MRDDNQRKKGIKKIFIFLITIFLFFGTIFVMWKTGLFNVKHIDVVGNKQFSSVEISNHILSDKYCKYAPYLFIKYKLFKPKQMPFVADIDVKLTSINTVEVNVKEKPIVAYAEHLNSHIFFDCDGIIVESSDRTIPNLVRLDGLDFKNYKLYEKPDLENPIILNSLSKIVRRLNKYNLSPSSMSFNERGEIDIYFDRLKVQLGMQDNLDEKMSRIAAILPILDEKQGTLKLNTYRKSGDSIIYKKNIL